MFIISLVNLLLSDYSIYYIHFGSLVKTTEYFAIQNLAVPKQHTLEYF